jgi:hypothetical protein
MNAPIARGLRGLLYVLSDLSQVDPSDLSMLFAGEGRLRMGFAEIDPDAGSEPSEAQIDAAARACWDDSYYAFRGPVGTSLVCIQGDWSNLVDAKIKSRLASLAVDSADAAHPYNPLYARAGRAPKPWGVTAVFAEYTGPTASLELDWTISPKPSRAGRQPSVHESPVPVPVSVPPADQSRDAPPLPAVAASTRDSAAPASGSQLCLAMGIRGGAESSGCGGNRDRSRRSRQPDGLRRHGGQEAAHDRLVPAPSFRRSRPRGANGCSRRWSTTSSFRTTVSSGGEASRPCGISAMPI